jgi:AcrR family transcriptional regulator
MATKRKYELKKRAEQLAETRRRITETTVELHRTVGPAATRISEIARRAGVQRVTVYNHFPDDASLLTACSAHWRALHPAPDPNAWDGDLRKALHELYAWYRETEPMTANILRDAQTLPALQAIVDGGLGAYLDAVRDLLAEPFGVGERVDAALRAALDFHFWRALASLGDEEAAELAAGFVELAARRSAHPIRSASSTMIPSGPRT